MTIAAVIAPTLVAGSDDEHRQRNEEDAEKRADPAMCSGRESWFSNISHGLTLR